MFTEHDLAVNLQWKYKWGRSSVYVDVTIKFHKILHVCVCMYVCV